MTNLTLGAGDEENGRPQLGGLGEASGGGGVGARQGVGFIAPIIERIARLAIIVSGGGVIGGGGNCVAAAAFLVSGQRAGDADRGDVLTVLADQGDGWMLHEVRRASTAFEPCMTLVTESGIELTCSLATPITTREDGKLITIAVAECIGALVPVLDEKGFRWEEIAATRFAGAREVRKIDCWNATYAAGDAPGRYIFTHNKLGGDADGGGL